MRAAAVGGCPEGGGPALANIYSAKVAVMDLLLVSRKYIRTR